MGKISEKAITGSDIQKFLENDDSFPFELQVLQRMNTLLPEISVTYGGIYFDTDLKHNRQYDIQAQLPGEDNLYISLAIECKAINENFPLIVKTSPRLPAEAYINSWLFVRKIERFQNDTMVSSRIVGNGIQNRKYINSHFYPIDVEAGRSVFQLGHHIDSNRGFECNESDCYDKWTQSLSSMNAMIAEVSKLFVWQENTKGFVYGEYLFIPILVVPDNTLWSIHYSTDGQQQLPQKIDRIPFFVNREYLLKGERDEKLKYNVSHLEIMTITGLSSFLNNWNEFKEIIFGPNPKFNIFIPNP